MLRAGQLDVPYVTGILSDDLGPADERIRQLHAVRDETVGAPDVRGRSGLSHVRPSASLRICPLLAWPAVCGPPQPDDWRTTVVCSDSSPRARAAAPDVIAS